MKALIVAPSWIGDAVLAQPLFMRLRERTPGLELHALAPRWVAPVLLRMPEISSVIDNPFGHGQLQLGARWQLGRALAAHGFDRAYVLPNSLKSALIPFMAGIPERIGFTGESRIGLINRRHTLDKTLLPEMAERFAQLAEPVGAPCRALAPAAAFFDPRTTGMHAGSPWPGTAGKAGGVLPRRRIRPGQTLADTPLRHPGH